jgi:acyl-CoA reductase-like NAD-dependent aldehyde dehydrogenase
MHRKWLWSLRGHHDEEAMMTTVTTAPLGHVAVPEFEVDDPATGQVVGVARNHTVSDLDAAMEAAAGAFGSWSRAPDIRTRGLLALASVMEDNQVELATLTTKEQGKPFPEAVGEVLGAAMILRHCAGLDLPVSVLHDGDAARVELRRRPIGPVVAITPWNGPLYMLAMKLGPALAAGNTVVAKPSPVTPLATVRFGELAHDAVPEGVFQVLTDCGDLGARMVAHPLTRKVSFTGSVATGRRVALSALDDFKRVTLELGGNDPAIVLADADLGHACSGLASMAFGNAGQICVAPKRIYAEASQYAEVVERLASAAATLRVGGGFEEGVEMGPLTTPEQRDYVEELIADALGRGARLVTGGKRLGERGNFLSPAVLADVPDDARVVTEEQFGPVIPVMAYHDLDDAIHRANDTTYGLGASVWGHDRGALADVGSRLDAGQVWLNTHRDVATPAQPVIGLKWSGVGAENGELGFLDFTDPQMWFEAKVGGE